MPPRKRLTVALSNFPASSPALQAPDQPHESVTAAASVQAFGGAGQRIGPRHPTRQ